MKRIACLLAVGLGAGALDAQLPPRLSPPEFAALIERLSESGGYFDTDNLVSNEDSYLHAITGLRRHGVSGGVYVGVGPDQNFSYIAAIRPAMAFIVDIRRDNLLEHLLFKAIFAGAKALAAIGEYVSARGARVSTFYTSNVEHYLFEDGTCERFARNLASPPHGERSVIIRSYFAYGRAHPQAVSGYVSVQLLQRFSDLVAAQQSGGYRGYFDLVRRDVLEPR